MTSFAQVFRPELANAEDMTQFHSDEYIEFLRMITPDNQHEFQYKDEASNCFSFKQHEVECPSDDSLIQSIPIQHNQK